MLPIGPSVDIRPAGRPGCLRIEGAYCRIEALDANRHCADLWRAFKDGEFRWTYLPYGPFVDEHSFAAWLEGRAKLDDPISYVVIDAADGAATGIVALRNMVLDMRTIEVGHLVYGPAAQGSRIGVEAHYLLARCVFEQFGYRRYEWRCNALNERSNRAARRLGFTFEGIFRQHLIVKGRSRDTAWYSMLDSEWPARKAAFERWLAPENFDPNGRQMTSLSSLNTVE